MYEYAIYSGIVSLVCTLVYFNPVLTAAIKKGVNNSITRNPQSSMFTWQLMTVAIAPMFTLILLWPEASRKFKTGLESRVFLDE